MADLISSTILFRPTGFVLGDLHEEVYMKAPCGLSLPQPDLICKLQRSLYGLKQDSRRWNTKLTETLTHSGYNQSKVDYSLFTKKSPSRVTAILVYADDLVLGRGGMLMKFIISRPYLITNSASKI